MVSMANGDERESFLRCCDGCALLAKKHTIFGRAIPGLDTIHTIRNVRANKTDKIFTFSTTDHRFGRGASGMIWVITTKISFVNKSFESPLFTFAGGSFVPRITSFLHMR